MVTWLDPVSGIVAGALGGAALVMVYVLKLRRRPVRVSSTALWLWATQDVQVNVPFRWLRLTWLFVLQLLALACLAAALGRPVLGGGDGGARRIVIVVDRSASMSAGDGWVEGRGVTRLEEAKARAVRLIDELRRGGGSPQVGVVELAAAGRATGAMSTNLGDARAAVEAVEASDQPGDLGAALRVASAMLRTEDRGEESAREPGAVYLFSDGGFPAGESLSVAGATVRFERVGGRGAAGQPVPAADDEGRDNVGIVAVSARRDFVDPGVVGVFVRLQSALGRAVTAPVVLSVDGAEVARRVVTVPAAGAGGPGTVAVTLEHRGRSAAVATVRIDRQDLLAADDSASVVLSAAGVPRVLLVTPDDAGAATAGGGADAGWLLRAALAEMRVPVRVLPESGYARDAGSGGQVSAELVVFDRVRPRVAPPVATLSFGAGLPVPGLDGRGAAEGGTYVLAWSRGHPVLRDVALDAVYVARALRLADPSRAAGEAAVRVSELARGAGGPLMLLGEERGVRRIVVGFDLAQSNWPVQVSFPIFLASAIDFLTLRGDERAGRAFTTAEAADVELPAGAARGEGARVVLEGPRRVEVEARAGEEAGRGGRVRVGVGVLERAGVYGVVEPGEAEGAAPRAVAVNLADAVESAVAVAERVRVSGEAVEGDAGGEGRRELWPWLVLIAAGLLCVEWTLNAWRTRV